MKKIINFLQAIPKYVWILSAIVLLGIFLRGYEFNDWLLLGPDQGRNAIMVGAAVDGTEPIPTLGPLAAGSYFKLGAIFYQIQYFSAEIFGNNPQAMAYPDLFFGIASIPLFFFLMRRLFSTNISLALSAIMSLSYFFIAHSRFSSNPNAIPFFIMMFVLGIFEMTKAENIGKYRWPIMVGIGAGIGIQQHTILFLAIPVVALSWMIFLFLKKRLDIKSLLIVSMIVIFLNFGQLLSEYRTGGANFKEFMIGLQEASGGEGESKVLRNVYLVGACQVQANFHFVSSIRSIEECGEIFKFKQKKNDGVIGIIKKNYATLLFAGLSILFTLFGYVVFVKRLFYEKDKHKKTLLRVLMSVNLATLAIMVPVATATSLRYHIILFFVPFIFLGFIAEEFLKKKIRYEKSFIVALLVLLLSVNLWTDVATGKKYANMEVNDAENSIFGETKLMAEFIRDNNHCPSETLVLDGQKDYLRRFFMPLRYLLGTSGINLISMEDEPVVDSSSCIFYVTKTDRMSEKQFDQKVIVDKTGIFGKIVVHSLRRK